MEPMFYWRDALDPLHLKHLSERNRARFGDFAANPDARAFVRAHADGWDPPQQGRIPAP